MWHDNADKADPAGHGHGSTGRTGNGKDRDGFHFLHVDPDMGRRCFPQCKAV